MPSLFTTSLPSPGVQVPTAWKFWTWHRDRRIEGAPIGDARLRGGSRPRTPLPSTGRRTCARTHSLSMAEAENEAVAEAPYEPQVVEMVQSPQHPTYMRVTESKSSW